MCMCIYLCFIQYVYLALVLPRYSVSLTKPLTLLLFIVANQQHLTVSVCLLFPSLPPSPLFLSLSSPICSSQLLDKERDYNRMHCGIGSKFYGLPPQILDKKFISLSGYVKNDVNHYLLESVNSLSSVSLIPGLIDDALKMIVREKLEGKRHGEFSFKNDHKRFITFVC